MSCQDCEKAQESNDSAFYGWSIANIEIRGCKKHLLEVFEALNEAQKAKYNLGEFM